MKTAFSARRCMQLDWGFFSSRPTIGTWFYSESKNQIFLRCLLIILVLLLRLLLHFIRFWLISIRASPILLILESLRDLVLTHIWLLILRLWFSYFNPSMVIMIHIMLSEHIRDVIDLLFLLLNIFIFILWLMIIS